MSLMCTERVGEHSRIIYEFWLIRVGLDTVQQYWAAMLVNAPESGKCSWCKLPWIRSRFGAPFMRGFLPRRPWWTRLRRRYAQTALDAKNKIRTILIIKTRLSWKLNKNNHWKNIRGLCGSGIYGLVCITLISNPLCAYCRPPSPLSWFRESKVGAGGEL